MLTVIYCRNNELNKNTVKDLGRWEMLEITGFSEQERCIDNLKKTNAKLIFISVEEPYGIPDGLMRYISEENSSLVTCIIGSSEDQAKLAYRYGCDAFILRDDLQNDISRKINDLILLTQRVKPVRLITFGIFEMIYKGRCVDFHSSKAKELLALCTDRRGQRVSIAEAADKLWADRPYDDQVKVLYRKAVMNLRNLFRDLGLEGFFIAERGYCFINAEMASCDYYDFLNAPSENSRLFSGTYLYEYSWAEETLASIENLYRRFCED